VASRTPLLHIEQVLGPDLAGFMLDSLVRHGCDFGLEVGKELS
jgi:hypothetical protein